MLNNKKLKPEHLIIFSLTVLIFFLLKLLLNYPFFSNIVTAFLAVFFPFIISFIIVYVFHPLLYWIEKHFSIKTWMMTTALFTISALSIIFLVDYLIPIISNEIYNFIVNFPKFKEGLIAKITQLKTRFDFLKSIDTEYYINYILKETTQLLGEKLPSILINGIISFFQSLFYIIIIPILVFIMTKDYFKIRSKIALSVSKLDKKYLTLLQRIDKKLGAFIRGQFIIILYMFLGTFIPLIILGMPNAFIFSLIIAITNLIPYMGPYIGAVPLCLYALIIYPELFFACIIIVIVMQQLDGNILQPIVYGAQLDIHPLIIMIALLVGGSLFGLLGIIISVPIYIVISETINFIKENKKQKEKSAS